MEAAVVFQAPQLLYGDNDDFWDDISDSLHDGRTDDNNGMLKRADDSGVTSLLDPTGRAEGIPRSEGNWWTTNAVFLGAAGALLIIVGFILKAGVVRDGSPLNMEAALTVLPVRPIVPSPRPHVPLRRTLSPCLTRGCRDASAFLRRTLNEDIDPCRNFAKFVCSGAEAGYDFFHEVDSALLDASASTLDAVVVIPRRRQTATQRATALFRACVADRTDHDVEELRTLLKQHGLLSSERQQQYPAEVMLRLAARYGNGVLFSVSWYVEPKGIKVPVQIERNDDFAVWMDSSNQRTASLRADCVDTVMNVVYGYDSPDDLQLLREIVLGVEDAVQVLWSNATLSRPTTGLIDDIGPPTSSLLVEALNEAAERRSTFSLGDRLQVRDRGTTIDLMNSALGSLDARHFLLYLGFEFVRQIGSLVSERLHHASCFNEDLRFSLGSRRNCARLVRELAGLAAHGRYFLQLFDPMASGRASSAFRNVKRELQYRIRGARWMPLQTRKAVLSRLNKTRAVIAFPTVMQSEQLLDAYYAGVPDMDGVLFKDILSWRRTGIAQLLRRKYLEVFSLNVSYDSGRNVLLVPTFLALPPLFSEDGPAAVHYGYLGLQIAKKLASVAFQLEAHSVAMRTAIGRNCDALSAEDLASVFASSVVSDAYKKATDASTGFTGGDLGSYSDAQVLFMAACAPYCSKDATSDWGRTCNTPLSHLPAFARAFKCAKGTPMRPARQCLAL